MISTLIALPYEIARLPLVVADQRLSRRLPETSATRVTLDRAIGSADRLAGAVLRSRAIAERGADRIERLDDLLAASRLEQEASARREKARETENTGRQEAARKRQAAQDRAASGLDEADAVEARAKQDAAAKAAKTAASRKRAADKRAATRKATVEQRKAGAESSAEAKKQAAQRKARTELDDARETKQAATEARAHAERLGELTDVKKDQRKQG
jgi:hypothetical protein